MRRKSSKERVLDIRSTLPAHLLKHANQCLKRAQFFFSFFFLVAFNIFKNQYLVFFFLLLIHLNEQYDPEARVYFIEKLKYNLRLQNDGEKWAKKFRSKNNLFTNLRNYL